MKITSIKMNRYFFASLFITTALVIVSFTSCKKETTPAVIAEKNAGSYSSDVIKKWMTIQLRLMRNATGVPNHAFSRHFAYSGIAAFESLVPGLKGTEKKWSEKWNGLTNLPGAHPSAKFFYPANVNAALAAINRSFFPNASVADKFAVDSLENALNQEFFASENEAAVINSIQFGKDVAAAVYAWAETDGYKNANAPYAVPVGPGLWKPTPPAFAAPATPYWGNNRTIITSSTINTQPAAPVAYSTTPGSAFYQMVKHVYDVSQTLTDDQKAMAIFWRDIPGVSSPGHWLSILLQVMQSKETDLDKAALAYALTGTAINDALISCFQTKYKYNLVRPVTYIREVMGYTTWNSYIGTPAHPEYSSAHASLSAAAADVLTELFGNPQSFTDRTYDYLGFAPRTYSSYTAIGEEAGMSRLYAGIHYLQTIQAGLTQGKQVAANIFSKSN